MTRKKQGRSTTKRGGARPGAGRPQRHPEGLTEVTAATVPGVLLQQLDEWAVERRMCRSEAITEAVRRLVADI